MAIFPIHAYDELGVLRLGAFTALGRTRVKSHAVIDPGLRRGNGIPDHRATPDTYIGSVDPDNLNSVGIIVRLPQQQYGSTAVHTPFTLDRIAGNNAEGA